jgi:hypothetical protein
MKKLTERMMAPETVFAIWDVNGDNVPDLVCHFYIQNTGFLSDDTLGVLRGKTVDGVRIQGTDSVRIIH